MLPQVRQAEHHEAVANMLHSCTNSMLVDALLCSTTESAIVDALQVHHLICIICVTKRRNDASSGMVFGAKVLFTKSLVSDTNWGLDVGQHETSSEQGEDSCMRRAAVEMCLVDLPASHWLWCAAGFIWGSQQETRISRQERCMRLHFVFSEFLYTYGNLPIPHWGPN